MAEKDYYKILNVNKNATPEQIKKSFRKLALKWHPDKNRDNVQKAEKMFKQIAEAYAVLTDPEKKRMYDQFGSSNHRQSRQQQQQQQYSQHFTFTEEDIEEIYRQFFKFNADEQDDAETAQFIFEHIFNQKAPRILSANSAIETQPFRFHSKQTYYVQMDKHLNQKVASYRIAHPFEKSNREYGREILEIVKCLLQSLPFEFASGAHTKHEHHSEQDEYHLLAALINTQHTNRYLFSAKCIELAQRLYNLRNHLIYWTRSKKQMSFKSVNHYMNAAKQFIEALQNHPQFQYIQFCKHFKVAQLNLDVLHQQFLSHRAKDVHQREKHGNLRKALDTAYDEYRCYTSTRTKWFLAGMLSTIAVIVWLVRNVDLDDIQDPEPTAQSRKR